MKKGIIIICLPVILLLVACQDVVDLDVPDTVKGIVIDGRITDSIPVQATVGITTGYFDHGQIPRISNATVWLLENNDTVAQLYEDSEPGLYGANYTGTIGKTYQLVVEISNNSQFRNSTWLSSPEEMKRVFVIDSTNVRFLDRNTTPQAFDEGDHALMYFQEPAGSGDFYRMKIWHNDSLYDQKIVVFDDENFDGYYIGEKGGIPAFNYYGPFKEHEDDTARVEISSITQDYFEFLSLINEQVFRVGSPFDPPPQTIIGNIYNSEDSTEYAYGYFSASALSTAETWQ